MTAGKRAPTRKQTSADFSRHSQNYAFSVKTCSWKRKARTRRGWTWTGCPSVTQPWSVRVVHLWSEQSSAVTALQCAETKIALHRVSDKEHPANYVMLLIAPSLSNQRESSSALVKGRFWNQNQCCRSVVTTCGRGRFFFGGGGAETRVMFSLWQRIILTMSPSPSSLDANLIFPLFLPALST